MEDKIMRKKLGIFLSLWLCISMIWLPFASTQVRAAETNMATLNFIGASIENGKATFAVDDAYKVRLTLCTRDIVMDSYTNCPINGNNMQIDLSDKEYYLKATTVLDVSSPDDLLGISSVKLQLYINDESYDISSNPYVKLDTNRFSGNLNFRIEKVSTPPNPGYPDDIQIMGTYDGFGMEIYLNSAKIGAESSQIQGTGKGYASGEIYNLLRIQLAFGDGDIGTVTVNYDHLRIPKTSLYQVENTCLAVASFDILMQIRDMEYEKNAGADVRIEQAVRSGLLDFSWEGRMEEIAPDLFVDGAHNPEAVECYCRTLRTLYTKKKKILVFAAVKDKDYDTMIRDLTEELSFEKIIVTSVDNKRKAPVALIADRFRKYTGHAVEAYEDIAEAMNAAIRYKEQITDSAVYCVGSLYLVGEVKRWLSGIKEQSANMEEYHDKL